MLKLVHQLYNSMLKSLKLKKVVQFKDIEDTSMKEISEKSMADLPVDIEDPYSKVSSVRKRYLLIIPTDLCTLCMYITFWLRMLCI